MYVLSQITLARNLRSSLHFLPIVSFCDYHTPLLFLQVACKSEKGQNMQLFEYELLNFYANSERN